MVSPVIRQRNGGAGMRPSRLSQALFPFESRFLEGSDALIHYVDEGTGPTILFLHPAPASSFIYRAFIAQLRGRFRCIALDYPGFGLSVPHNGFALTLENLAGAVADFVEALDLRGITLMVHDSGGPVGLGAATQAPQRYRAFILTDTLAFPVRGYPPVEMMLRLVTSAPFRALNRHFNLLPWLVSTMAPVGRRLSPEERAAYRHLFPTPETRDRILLLFRQLVDNPRYLARLEADLQRHFREAPALLMFGQFDPVRLVGWVNRLQGIFPRHQVQIIPREGHFPHEGSPQSMIDAIVKWYDAVLREGEIGLAH
jgi:haloalkane dehalogenase